VAIATEVGTVERCLPIGMCSIFVASASVVFCGPKPPGGIRTRTSSDTRHKVVAHSHQHSAQDGQTPNWIRTG
jgi:hypothetical protein